MSADIVKVLEEKKVQECLLISKDVICSELKRPSECRRSALILLLFIPWMGTNDLPGIFDLSWLIQMTLILSTWRFYCNPMWLSLSEMLEERGLDGISKGMAEPRKERRMTLMHSWDICGMGLLTTEKRRGEPEWAEEEKTQIKDGLCFVLETPGLPGSWTLPVRLFVLSGTVIFSVFLLMVHWLVWSASYDVPSGFQETVCP